MMQHFGRHMENNVQAVHTMLRMVADRGLRVTRYSVILQLICYFAQQSAVWRGVGRADGERKDPLHY